MWKNILKAEQVVGQRQSLFLPEHLEVEDRDDCLDKIEEMVAEVITKTRMLSNHFTENPRARFDKENMTNDVACWVLDELKIDMVHFEDLLRRYARTGQTADFPSGKQKVFNGVVWTYHWSLTLNDGVILHKLTVNKEPAMVAKLFIQEVMTMEEHDYDPHIIEAIKNAIGVPPEQHDEDISEDIIRFIKNRVDWSQGYVV